MKQQNRVSKVWVILTFVYVLSTSLQTLLLFPVVGLKIQIPEIIFLLLFSFLLINKESIPRYLFRMNGLDMCLLSYPFIILITSFFAPNFQPFLEAIGSFYLFSLYFSVKTLFIFHQENRSAFLFSSMFWMGMIAAFFGLLGKLLAAFQVETSLVFIYENYPYFGDSIRAEGFTSSPTMLANILCVSMLFLISKMWFQKSGTFFYWTALVFMLFAYVLTLSKGVFLLLIGIIFIFYRTPNLSVFLKRLMLLSSIVLGFAYLFGTHFLVIDQQNSELANIQSAHYNVGKPITTIQNKLIIPTAYTSLKQASILMGITYPLRGVGAGNHAIFIDQLKTEDKFPSQIPSLDPHSTFFGAFAELGLLGIASLLIIVYAIGQAIVKLLSKCLDYTFIALGAVFLVFVLEAISTDMMNFRHLWFLLGCVSSFIQRDEKRSKNIN